MSLWAPLIAACGYYEADGGFQVASGQASDKNTNSEIQSFLAYHLWVPSR